MDYSPTCSSVHEILQARILDWVAISFSRGSSWPRDWIHISCVLWPSHPQKTCPLITSHWLQNSNLWMLGAGGGGTDIQATTGWWAWRWDLLVSTPTSTICGGREAVTQQKGRWSQKRPREDVQANATGANGISSFAHIGVWFHLHGMSRRGRCVETKVDLWLPREAWGRNGERLLMGIRFPLGMTRMLWN